MFALTTPAIAIGLLVPALLGPATCQEDACARLAARPPHRTADARAMARFVDAAHDYAAFGKTGSIFNPEAAEVLRFQLRFSRWLHRYNPVETLSEPAPARYVTRATGVSILDVLPPLPEPLEYRLYGRHLLLVDRRTRQVVDILDDALGH
jgi:hypothetical protein